MAFAGLAITLIGWIIAVSSVGVTTSGYARGGMVVVGILVSLFGIVGVLNQAYLKDAIWKK